MKGIFILVCVVLLNTFVFFGNSSVYSSKREIDMALAEKLVKKEFGGVNDIDKVISFTKHTVGKIKSNTEVTDKRGILYKENSHLFLTLISISFRESTFRNIKGSRGEIGYWQILPSTGQEIVINYKIPLNGKKLKERLWDGKFNAKLATIYISKHLEDRDFIEALSRYNGDKSLKYGKRIEKTFKEILENENYYGKQKKINKQKKIG